MDATAVPFLCSTSDMLTITINTVSLNLRCLYLGLGVGREVPEWQRCVCNIGRLFQGDGRAERREPVCWERGLFFCVYEPTQPNHIQIDRRIQP